MPSMFEEASALASMQNASRYRGKVKPDLVWGHSASLEASGAIRYGPLDLQGRAWHIAAEFKFVPRRRLMIDAPMRQKMKHATYRSLGIITGNADTLAQSLSEGSQAVSVDELLEDMSRPFATVCEAASALSARYPKCEVCGDRLPIICKQYCSAKCRKSAQNRRAYLAKKNAIVEASSEEEYPAF